MHSICFALTWLASLSVPSELAEEPGTTLEPNEMDQIKVKLLILITYFSHFNSEKV